MQTTLSTNSDIIAILSNFVKRERKLHGSNFVQTLVFGWLANPSASLEELTQTAATLGVSISLQGYILVPAKPLRVETPTENVVAVVEEFLAGSASV